MTAADPDNTDSLQTIALDPSAPPRPALGPNDAPSQVADFRLGKRLGAGGMGMVHEAVSPRFPGTIALKLLKPEVGQDPDFCARFDREILSMRAIDHPNIVRLLDAGNDGGWRWMALELMTKGDLAHYLRRRTQLFEKDAITLAIQCCRGLTALHAAGIVHRDLKPGNIFLGQGNAVKIGDLGMARQTSGEDRMTMTGVACGTPTYMAPEQIHGLGDLDARLDVYAMGAVLYTLLTGAEPYDGATVYIITHKALTEPLPDPRRRNPLVSAAVTAVITKACAKDRADRYQAIEDLMADLERVHRGQAPVQVAVQALSGPTPGAAPTVLSRIGGAAGQATGTTAQATAAPSIMVGVGGTGMIRPMASGGWWSDLPPSARYAIPMVLVAMVLIAVLSSMEVGFTAPRHTAAVAAPGATSDAYGSYADLAVGEARFRLRWCPAGTFRMGSPAAEPGRTPDETEHQVTLTSGFWILDREVTAKQYSQIDGGDEGDDRPVTGVTATEAGEWLVRLGKRLETGTPRLPSEAEWEYAARAGTTTAFAGDTARLVVAANAQVAAAWAEAAAATAETEDRIHHVAGQSGASSPLRVASREPNPWGLFDCHGNVMEWCLDRTNGIEPLPAEAQTDPLGTTGALTVARGGSWMHPLTACRSASRATYDLILAKPWIGFRFVIPGERTAVPRGR